MGWGGWWDEIVWMVCVWMAGCRHASQHLRSLQALAPKALTCTTAPQSGARGPRRAARPAAAGGPAAWRQRGALQRHPVPSALPPVAPCSSLALAAESTWQSVWMRGGSLRMVGWGGVWVWVCMCVGGEGASRLDAPSLPAGHRPSPAPSASPVVAHAAVCEAQDHR